MLRNILPTTLIAPLLIQGVRGHVVMNLPPSYNLNSQPFLQLSPLNGAEYLFPCQNRYGVDVRTDVQAGGATLVNFTGTALHGGGSCQFSISYDDPTVGGWNTSATFKTIYSIIGGCPAVYTNETKNIDSVGSDIRGRDDGHHCGNDHDVDCVRQFLVPIPSLEMYMNCAPINITGGTGDQKQIDDLPDIFVANVPIQEIPNNPYCVLGQSMIVNYPNPGKHGRILSPPTDPKEISPSYCSQIPPASNTPSFMADSRTIANTESAMPSNTVVPVPTASMGPSSDSGMGTKTIVTVTTTTTVTQTASMGSCPVVVTVTAMAMATANDSSTAVATSCGATSTAANANLTTVATSSGATPTATNDEKVPCQPDGAVICIDGGMWGLCDHGFAIPQQLAAGTTCVGGRISKVKRHLHAHQHYHHNT
ncbi:hypothetical protein B0T17DRAFT_506755 [Bombardia bombarda]|uniref:Uncharacterized protein n=1 Tax=Bombardia bombarda TaxID=252184 RepID=A0AA39XBM5_9PEZI|nr:hypothetical protein B0T17DRAFT_506755 [Bombardia bombarda]